MDQALDSARTFQSKPGSGPVVAAYAVTIFISAFLLFQVQPLISKFILPWFGGSPAVWTAAMLFFQLVLFGGYLYAHLTSTYLSPRGQFILHLVLLVSAAALGLYTRITPWNELKPRGDATEDPMLLILALLGVTVGLPYFVLSSTGPLLQKWFSDAFDGVSPYRLFALSNFGSLLALLSYPFFFEVMWDSREQAVMWSMAFVVFAICCAFCAWWTFRAREANIANPTVKSTAKVSDAPPAWQWIACVFLPALASVMFVAVTSEVTQNVAPVPLLWIIPLSLYLISFIVAFDHPRWYSRPIYAGLGVLVLLCMANFAVFGEWLSMALNALGGYDEDNGFRLWKSWALEGVVFFAGLFIVCMMCHCEMAAIKPSPKYLTAFFLLMSLGGALGGVFVNFVAPYVFVTFFELPLAMLAATTIAALLLTVSARQKSLPWGVPLAPLAATAGAVAVGAVLYYQVLFGTYQDPDARHLVVYRARNFYGIVGVEHRSRDDKEFSTYTFISGTIRHGRQFVDPAKKHEPIAYWGPGTGCRVAMEYVTKREDCHIGVVGLGIGTIAEFAEPGQKVRMYEINPEVVKIALDPRWFNCVSECRGETEIVLGDARLKLEQELEESGGKGNQFDVLCLDAFTGDAVPAHLLTTEAFELYKKHMKPDGIIVVNIINTYLDLFPVVKRLADEHGYKYTRIYKKGGDVTYRTYFMMLTNDEKFLAEHPEDIEALPAGFRRERTVPLWTDRYHNLFQILQ